MKIRKEKIGMKWNLTNKNKVKKEICRLNKNKNEHTSKNPIRYIRNNTKVKILKIRQNEDNLGKIKIRNKNKKFNHEQKNK